MIRCGSAKLNGTGFSRDIEALTGTSKGVCCEWVGRVGALITFALHLEACRCVNSYK